MVNNSYRNTINSNSPIMSGITNILLAEIELTSLNVKCLIVKFHRKLFNYFVYGISRFLDQYVS